MSELEDAFEKFITRFYHLPPAVREYVFAPPRKWRFDFAWPEQRVAVEIDGATWTQGRHTRGAGFERDCEKMNEAVLMGWRVLRFSGSMLGNDPDLCMKHVQALLNQEPGE